MCSGPRTVGGAFVSDNDYAIAARCDERVIMLSERNIRDRPKSESTNGTNGTRYEALSNIIDHTANYIKNFPSRITCWPSNQMSKSRPTQSICVLEAQFAPVCSA